MQPSSAFLLDIQTMNQLKNYLRTSNLFEPSTNTDRTSERVPVSTAHQRDHHSCLFVSASSYHWQSDYCHMDDLTSGQCHSFSSLVKVKLHRMPPNRMCHCAPALLFRTVPSYPVIHHSIKSAPPISSRMHGSQHCSMVKMPPIFCQSISVPSDSRIFRLYPVFADYHKHVSIKVFRYSDRHFSSVQIWSRHRLFFMHERRRLFLVIKQQHPTHSEAKSN